jgi:uncharacterized protein YjbJ (UPF0337 family)
MKNMKDGAKEFGGKTKDAFGKVVYTKPMK